jgi:hypothetical protein
LDMVCYSGWKRYGSWCGKAQTYRTLLTSKYTLWC